MAADEWTAEDQEDENPIKPNLYKAHIEERISLIPMPGDGSRFLAEGWYTSANGGMAAVVAVLNFTSDQTRHPAGPGYLIDWAAYFGGGTDTGKRVENLPIVASTTGNKISEQHARWFFPQLPQWLYRR